MSSNNFLPHKPNPIKRKLYVFLTTFLLVSLACGIPPLEEAVPEQCSTEFLIAAVEAAQVGAGAVAVEIDLAPGCLYILTASNNTVNGANGLASIVNETIIHGNGATIRRDAAADLFRFFHVDEGGILRLDNVTLENGNRDQALSKGGAILVNSGGFLEVTDSLFQNNAAEHGGAINIAINGEIIITNTEFRENISSLSGGAIYTFGSGVITDSTFTNNTAGNPGIVVTELEPLVGYGGAIYMASGSGSLPIEGSTFYSNQAGLGGGAINLNVGTITLENSTFSDNSAPLGGAISNAGDLSLNYVTVVNNSAAEEGGGVVTEVLISGGVTIKNSIVALNTGGNCAIRAGSFSALNSNLDNDSTCTGFTINADPAIEPLADNGGPTMTHALMPSSPAINAAGGECPTVDQRDATRPFPPGSNCDLGAYELSEMVPTSSEDDDIELITVTPTPTPVPPLQPSVVNTLTLCWKGPGPVYDVVNSIQPGEEVKVLGRGDNEGWIVLESNIYAGVACWVEEKNLDLDPLFSFEGLKIFAVPSTPTPTLPPTATPTPNPLPAAPSNFVATTSTCVQGKYEVTLSWSDNTNNESGYRVYREGQIVADLGKDSTQYIDLPGGQGPYTYFVEVFNNFGTAVSSSTQDQGCVP